MASASAGRRGGMGMALPARFCGRSVLDNNKVLCTCTCTDRPVLHTRTHKHGVRCGPRSFGAFVMALNYSKWDALDLSDDDEQQPGSS